MSGFEPEDKMMDLIRTYHGNHTKRGTIKYVYMFGHFCPSATSGFEPKNRMTTPIRTNHGNLEGDKSYKKNKPGHFCPSAASGLEPEDRDVTPCPHLRGNQKDKI